MTSSLRALRLRRLTASFGLVLPAAIAAVGAFAVASTPTAAFARPQHHRHGEGNPDRSHSPRETVRVRVQTARLRSGPGEGHHASTLLDRGQTARVVERHGDWAEVRTASGDRGWVRADLLRVAKHVKSDQQDADAASARRRHHAAAEEERHVRVAQAAHPRHHVEAVAAAAHHSRVAQASHARSHPAPVKVAKAAVSVSHQHPAAPKRPAFVAAGAARPFVRRSTPAAAFGTHTPDGGTGQSLTVDSATATMTITDARITLASLGERPTAAAAAPASSAAPAAAAAATPEVAVAKPAAPVVVAQAGSGFTHAGLDRSMARGERLVRSALSYRGTPYRMGATGRGAFDCSGFTMYLFDKEGTQLPRTAEEQYAKGQPVAKADLMPGDLVFFRNTYKHGISHVGIYIGAGQFCHAAGRSRGVRVDNLDKAFYVNHWAGARRPR